MNVAPIRRLLPVLAQRAGSSPFDDVAPSVAAALVFAVASAAWVVAGGDLPGGRWLAVHLFTLGVLSNVLLAFTGHFTDTLMKVPDDGDRGRRVFAFNVGAVAVMAGMIYAWPAAVALGATVATGAVLVNYMCMRRARHHALGARFTWIVRSYERAHGAFVHGAILGGLLGAGLLTGPWYASGRIAHLHVNLLGWAGVTLLATLVFFGPTMARTRIESGADDRAARTIRIGAHAVTAASLALVATGLGGTAGQSMRILAGLALGVFAWTATGICRAVARAVTSARPGAAKPPITALCRWMPLLAWTDALVVATGSWRVLDAVGLGLLLGVFVQAVTTTLTYLAPMLIADRNEGRHSLRLALDRYARTRSLVFNLGATAIVVVASIGPSASTIGAVAIRIGWAAALAATLQPACSVMLVRQARSRVS